MTTPEQLGFVRPSGTDLIRTGDDDISKNAEASAAMYDLLFSQRFIKGSLGSAEYPHMDSAPDGIVTVNSAATGTAAAFPFNAQGFALTVPHGASKTQYAFTFDGRIAERGQNGTTWNDWMEPTRWHEPLTSSDDLNNITTEGFYPKPYSTNPNAPGTSGVLFVGDAHHPSISFISQMLISGDGAGIVWRSARNGVFGEWSEIGTPAGSIDEGSARRDILISEARRRRGGKIGTSGMAVASLRFDHHWNPFKASFLPRLKEYALPWSIAMNSASPFADDKVNGSVPWATIQQDALNGGGEVTNHGRNHGDAGTLPAFRREIVQALSELKGFLPEMAIETFDLPGTGGSQLGGTSMTSLETTLTTAGRMILANHAFVSGAMGSHYRPLGGAPSVAHSHYTMDSATLNHWRTAIDTAIATGTGIQFMMHPSAIVDGTATVATLEAAFAYLAEKRDAGELLILSPSAALLADSGSNERRNLLRQDTLAANTPVTLNLTGAGGGYPVDFRGAIHEISVDGATTLTVTSDAGGLNTSVSNPVEGTKTRIFFNVPLSANQITVNSSRAVTNAILTAS